MRIRASEIAAGLFRAPKIYRLIAGGIAAIAVVLAIVEPVRMTEPDDWAYYFAARNFSQGRLVIDDALHNQQVAEAASRRGQLIQYVRIGPDRWALEKAPGAAVYLVPFQLLNIPKAAGILLLLAAGAVTYIVLRRVRNEKTACIGAVLMLTTPATLIMLFRVYMDTIYDSAFLFIGGGLYIYLMLRQKELKTTPRVLLAFFAFLCIGWSVVARYTNLPVAAVFGLHYVAVRVAGALRDRKWPRVSEVIAVVFGAGIPAAFLLVYHNAVFGSPFVYGYKYTQLPIKFAFQYLGQADAQGNSMALGIIGGNLRNMPLPLLTGFPLLAVAVPGIFYVLYRKLTGNAAGAQRFWPEVSWDIILLLLAWIICVFGLYMLYEWTAPTQMQNQSFIIKARFYLPGLLPLVIITALLMAEWSGKLVSVLLAVAVIAGFAGGVRSFEAGLGKLAVVAKPGQQAVTPGYQPLPGQALSPRGLSDLIRITRDQVRQSPTNEQNLKPRFNVLLEWALSLSEQGIRVQQVLPQERVWKLHSTMMQGNSREAAMLLDQAYADMERAFGGR